MVAPAWPTFAGVVAFVTVAIVVLARLSAGALEGDPDDGSDQEAGSPAPDADDGPEPDAAAATPDAGSGVAASMGSGALLANVALSQGLLGAILVFGAWFARIPPSAFGLGVDAPVARLLALGAGVGLVLYAGNELLAAVASRAGVAYSEALRELLAPDSVAGWAVLLGVALPVVAGFEELLFRGALVGAMAAGFGLSPWPLAVASSLLFGFAHGAQGATGMAVAAALGFALAVVFVLTGSLLVVVVAHYLVNALEFVVHEGLEVEWPSAG